MNLATGLLALFGAILISAAFGIVVGHLLRRIDAGIEPGDAAARRREIDALKAMYERNERERP